MYVPDRVLTNRDLEQLVDTSDEWIVERTGIRERRIAAPDQASSDLALIAAQRALAMAKVDAKDVDQIVLATTTPDRILPSCACTMQRKLGATKAAAYDMFAACTGFIFGMGLARGLIGGGVAETVLVVGVETLSRIVDYGDRNTCVLFGDGAGAAVFQACEHGLGIHAVDMRSDGELGEVLEVPAGISRNPASERTVAGREHFIRMQGKKLFPFAVRSMEHSTRHCCELAGWAADDVDVFVPHQANLRIIDGVRERLGLSPEKVYVNIDRFGNTSSASIPVALDELVRARRVTPGSKVAFAAFGGGATWGASTMTWTAPVPEPAELAAAGATGRAS
ncbi:MAG: ketoacyl-ACP synthase III [Candidatus Eisenbacteria bacterium]|nr:ketoacyl-ACP synthase III [Candidatus Eisenbacteria bacterium]